MTIQFVKNAAEMVRCGENHIYAATTHDFEAHMSKIDTTNNLYRIVENCVDSFRHTLIHSDKCVVEWGDPVLGIDSCIYWLPNEVSESYSEV